MLMFSAGILIWRVDVFVLQRPKPLPSQAAREEWRRNKRLIKKSGNLR